jgi:hypothetical protein
VPERDLIVSDRERVVDKDGGRGSYGDGADEPARTGVAKWLATRLEASVARVMDRFGRRPSSGAGDSEDTVALVRTGGAIARWISFPRGVRFATAATSTAAAALAAWGMIAVAADDLGIAAAAVGAAVALATAWGPLGVQLANRIHRLVAARRRHTISELRGIPDARLVAVRGVVIARQTAASAMDGRTAVWSLTRFRGGTWLARSFFHEAAFDFLLDDGSDEPIWIEVAGGMLLDPFPSEERVEFYNTTLLELAHPFLTRARLDQRQLWASEIDILPGDAIEVVGRLSRRFDPTAHSESGRDPPHRRALQSGTRVPVLIKKVRSPDAALARVRRQPAKAPPALSPGEPPLRKF